MKKFGIPILVGFLIGGIVSGGYLWWVKNKVPTSPPSEQVPPTPAQLLTWNDPNGFTFQYPEGLSVNKHEEDQDNYAHVELTSKDHPGSIIVWAKDTTATDVNAWVKTEKLFAGATVADAMLSGKPAKKIVLADGSKTIVGTIDDDILFTIETLPTDASYWSRIHDMTVRSFTLTAPQLETSASADTPAAEEVVDEEEILE